MKPTPVDYLGGYPADLRKQARALKATGELRERLEQRYPARHEIQGNAALYAYVMELKREHLKQSAPLSTARYHDRLSALHNALGTHTYATRVQGGKLKTKHELRVASLFKELPPEFLRMVVVHELAHLREKDHDKSFYRLCLHMEPDYHRYELDLRLWLFDRLG